jgi:hypothetical protein
MSIKRLVLLVLAFFLGLYLIGCFPASRTEDDDEDKTETTETTETTGDNKEVSDAVDADGAKIMTIANSEREKEMYSPKKDSTYLYWLNDRLALLKGSTKCNIFALNVLYRSGFKTPTENALCRDLVDTQRFTDILPVVGVQDISNAKKGDLVIWKGHVIIYESLVKIKQDLYALAWWAGTSQKDNGENIKNNVIYGKYKISGSYVVRRPVKK